MRLSHSSVAPPSPASGSMSSAVVEDVQPLAAEHLAHPPLLTLPFRPLQPLRATMSAQPMRVSAGSEGGRGQEGDGRA